MELHGMTDRDGLRESLPSPAPPEAEPPMLHLDCPALVDTTVWFSSEDDLWISGWALAQAGTVSIAISVDGEPLDAIAQGVAREDVAAAFADRDDAATSGFTATIPRALLPQGWHEVQITAQDETGASAEIEFFVDSRARSGGAPLALRAKLRPAEIALHDRVLAALGWRPTFHLALLVGPGDAEIERARATLSSLRGQTYPEWHVLIVPRRHRTDGDRLRQRLLDGCATVGTLRAGLADDCRGAGELCERVLAGFDEIAGRVAAATGKDMAPIAEIVADRSRPALFGIVAAGDELSADALAECAMASGLEREADFLYSDELRIAPAGGVGEPFLKPQWSPDLLLATNYIGRLWCATSELLARTGATLDELVRLGEYDLVLRLGEMAGAVRHIPKILCRRAGERLDGDKAERQALERALVRRGVAGEIDAGVLPGIYRVRRTSAAGGLVSIIIPTRGSRGLIRRCLETLRGVTAHQEFEIVCIDHNPARDPHWQRWLRAMADTVVEIDEPFNWSRFNNCAAAEARGAFLLFLNDDVEIIEPLWLDALLEHARRPEVGVVGALLLYPDRTVQHAGMYLTGEDGQAEHAFRHLREDDPGYFGLALTQRNVIAVTGACLLTRREVFERLGGFDEAHGVINNDLDYCLKAHRQGLLTVFTPYARLIHHERGSRGEEQEDYDAGAFRRKWRAVFAEGDPYYHPRLSPEGSGFMPDREPVRMICAGGPLLSRETVHRILVVKLDHIGDAVTAFPAVRRLKELFPQAGLCLLASRLAKPLWSLCAAVDEVIAFDFFHDRGDAGIRDVPEAELLSLRQRLLPYRFDLAVDLRKHADTRPVLQYSGARYLAGFDQERRFPWLDIAPDAMAERPFTAVHHAIGEDLVDLVAAIAARCEPQRPAISRPPPCRTRPLPERIGRRLFGRRVVCVHPGAGERLRQWPPRCFAALIDLLVDREQVNIALVGARDDAGIAAAILAAARRDRAVFDLVGRLALEQLPDLLLRASLFVGNNSGPHHLAAALGVPTIGIHSGVEDARQWGPVGPAAVALQRDMACGPCHLSHPAQCPRGVACLTGISPYEVYALCRRLLVIGAGEGSTDTDPPLRGGG